MKYVQYVLFFLLVAVAGGGSYIVFYTQPKEIDADTKTKDADTATKAGLQKDIAGLTTDRETLGKELAKDQAQMTDLRSQLETLKATIEQEKTDAAQAATDATEARAAADKTTKEVEALLHPPMPTNDLGTIVTVDRKTYQNCGLMKVQANGVIISSAQGTVQIFFPFLPAELQGRFGYDPAKPGDLSVSQVNYQESIRQQSMASALSSIKPRVWRLTPRSYQALASLGAISTSR
jgi:hypothetical protein